MKIAIDISQIAFRGSGVARYTEALIEALLSNTEHDYTFFYSSLRQKLPESLLVSLNDHSVKNYRIPPTILEIMWNQLHKLPIERFVGKQDLIMTSDWTEPPSRYPKVTTVHDLVYSKFPQTTTQRTDINLNNLQVSPNIVATQARRLEWVKRESKVIMCDSQSTKDDAQEILGISPDRLKVVYPGVKSILLTSNDKEHFEDKYTGSKPFILAVGKLEPRKNLQRLIDAFNSVESKLSGTELWIVGAPGWGEKVKDTSGGVRFLGYVTDQELSYLYSHALGFFMPSVYEGFGYPVVEAMQHGCPVAASKTSSLGEIVGNNGLLFDPHSTTEITRSIQQIVEDNDLRVRLKVLGLERAKAFSLEKFAKELFSVFTSAL